jgi:transposase
METTDPIRVQHRCCCGLDVHKQQVQACLLQTAADGMVQQAHRSFGTMTEDLLALLDWLVEAGCTHVAMESTGVYWKPIFNVLEGSVEVLVVNAQHIKQVPGRKTDVADAAWIAGRLRLGLLRSSFIPDRTQRQLRDLTRYRTSLVSERSAEVNRLQKGLEDANIKVAGVATDSMGKSGREMLTRLAAGETDATQLAQCARGRMKRKIPALEAALAGTVTEQHRYLLARQLDHIDYLDELIADVSARIAELVAPFEEEIVLLDSIPGVGRQIAENLVAEIGVDMGRFPSAAHLASWAGMAPGNHESAGKRKSGKTRKGSRWLRASLVVAAPSAGRSKRSWVGGRFRSLAARIGKKRASVAVGHTILEIAYQLLVHHEPFAEDHHRPKPPAPPRKDRLVNQLEALGYSVTLTPVAPAA